ncbi:MAG: hypothetical protein AAF349_07605 [Cyanobacteria bacterium P01_A01_bin.68]
MSNDKEKLNNKKINNNKNVVVKFLSKYLRSIKLSFIGILAAVIISLTPINTSKLPEYDDRPKVINGHVLEPETSTEETDIYVDGFTQQHRASPKPKIRTYIIKEDYSDINTPKN